MTKNVSHIISVTVILLMTTLISMSQTGVISIASTEGCHGDNIEIPVHASNLINLGAITLFIDYDPTVIEFDTLTDINTALYGLLFNDIEQLPGTYPGGKIGISWSGFSSVNITNDNLFILSFNYLQQNDSIIFSSNNEIADFEANIMAIDYVNGAISLSEEVSVTQQPNNLSIYQNEIGYLSVDGLNISGFAWEYLIDGLWIDIPETIIFSGQNSNTLNISSPDILLNETYFRCKLIGCNTIYSDSVQLFVQTNSIVFPHSFGSLSVYPNPATNQVNINIDIKTQGYYNLSLYNCATGKTNSINETYYLNTENTISLDTRDLKSGVYLIVLSTSSEGINYRLEKKVIIYK